MNRARRFVTSLPASTSPWQRGLSALICGLLAAATLPPFYMIPLLLPAFGLFFLLIKGAQNLRSAFFTGWGFGIGYFGLGFYWVSHAFYVDQAQYGWMAPFAVAGIAIGLGLYPAITALISFYVNHKFKFCLTHKIFIFAITWTFMEWVRGWAFTGLPWNLIGSSWGISESILQVSALIGPHGLDLITVVIATSGVLFLSKNTRNTGFVMVGLVVLIYAGGVLRLAGAESKTVEDVRLRLVQPNIPQHLKWKNDLRMGHVRNQIMASLKTNPENPPPTHIIWAETSVPYLIEKQPAILEALSRVAPEKGAVIVGALRAEITENGTRNMWNSLHIIDNKGKIVSQYDKKHLVPFGEYIPMRSILSLSKLTEGRGDFSVGASNQTLSIPGLPPVMPLICYEIIFADEVRSSSLKAENKPRWILNLTNDGWFGLSSGPYQHLLTARMRAIENGIPVIRVANTGISAIIDPYGRIVSSLALGQAGVLDGPLPASLGQTLYTRYGNWTIILVLFMFFVPSFIHSYIRKHKNT